MESKDKFMVDAVCKLMQIIDHLNEDAGYMILAKLRTHFHFEGNLYGRGDFEARLGRTLTNAEWEKIYSSKEFYYELCEHSDGDLYSIDAILDQLGFGA